MNKLNVIMHGILKLSRINDDTIFIHDVLSNLFPDIPTKFKPIKSNLESQFSLYLSPLKTFSSQCTTFYLLMSNDFAGTRNLDFLLFTSLVRNSSRASATSDLPPGS